MGSSTMKRRSAILLRAFSIGVFLCALSVVEATAQRFEYFYGADSCSEAGRNGVWPVSSGGYIACGETFSTVAACRESDAYVVRTDNHGAHVWERSYHIGGNDSATDIIECMDGTFVVIGVTQNDTLRCKRSRDLFVLRIDRCGFVIQVRTFGTDSTDEIGWDVIETQSGDWRFGTSPRDLVIAGSTTWADAPGPRDGWLLRINQFFAPIWGVTYDVNFNKHDDYLYGVDEALASEPGNDTTFTHDILACGGTNDDYLNGYDGWILRVDGNTGLIPLLGCQGTGIIGLPQVMKDEDFRQIQELTDSDSATNIVVVGREQSQTGVEEVYLAQTECKPWLLVTDRSLGDLLNKKDEGYYIREIKTSEDSAKNGNLIVTGYVTTDTNYGGFGKKDVFLQEYTPALVPLAPVTRIFGGDEDDWGWSVEPVQEWWPWATEGFIVAGFSESWLDDDCDFTGTDPRDLYLIKTDAAKSSNCNDTNYPAIDNIPFFDDRSASIFMKKLHPWCDPNISSKCHDWACELCLTLDCTIPQQVVWCPPCQNPPPDTTRDTVIHNDTLVFTRTSPGRLSSRLDKSPYPNPVTRGKIFAIEYALDDYSDLTLAVSDASGKEVYRLSDKFAPGKRLFPVSTRGWNTGAYFIQLTVGGRSITTQIVVVDR